jgi:hypothetical protein
LAPGDDATFNQLTDRNRRPPEPQRELPDELKTFQPPNPANIGWNLFVDSLRAAPLGASGGPGDTTYEHLKVALDDEDVAALLHFASLRLARAQVPKAIAEAFMLARMTALAKPHGGVRGIVTGSAFRRLVAPSKYSPQACRASMARNSPWT